MKEDQDKDNESKRRKKKKKHLQASSTVMILNELKKTNSAIEKLVSAVKTTQRKVRNVEEQIKEGGSSASTRERKMSLE